MLGEEQLQSVKLLRDALDVIQSINANDEFDAVKSLPELLNPLLDGVFKQVLYAPPGVRRVSSHHGKNGVSELVPRKQEVFAWFADLSKR